MMEIKKTKGVIGFSLILMIVILDLYKKRENYIQFNRLKQSYFELKKTSHLKTKPVLPLVDWPILLKIWNQKAEELNCQIQEIHTNNPGATKHSFHLKIQGRFFDLMAWLKGVQNHIPQLSWTKIVMSSDLSQQLIMTVEGRQNV